jgi:peptidylprolyl isomerase
MSMRKVLTALAMVVAGAAGAQDAVVDGDGPNLHIEIGGSVEGTIVIDLLPDVAPQHVERIITLAETGAYNDVAFHRVINGFMAQTGDVEFGKRGADARRAGTGGSELPDLPAEFSSETFAPGVVGMARAQNPNSANSQFFITTADASFLDGQYTVFGRVIEGMDVVNGIKLGAGQSGAVQDPDYMLRVTVSGQ